MQTEANEQTAGYRLISREELSQTRPAWATSLLVAERDVNQSDMMTDYFAHSTAETVFLGWSKHDRDLFSEMRKAAATFPPTAHLGPGKGDFTVRIVFAADVPYSGNGRPYYKGDYAPWFSERFPPVSGGSYDRAWFDTREAADAWVAAQEPIPPMIMGRDESGAEILATFEWNVAESEIEHRQKYSMGGGYYLKTGSRHSCGWKVRKVGLWYVGRGEGAIGVVDAPARAPKPAQEPAQDAPAAVDGVTLTENREKAGIELRFPSKPADAIRELLKARGWRWSRFSGCWYNRDNQDARESAAAIIARAGQ